MSALTREANAAAPAPLPLPGIDVDMDIEPAVTTGAPVGREAEPDIAADAAAGNDTLDFEPRALRRSTHDFAAQSPVRHLVIIAGGKGERLAHVTGGAPKALVRVGGMPVLAHQLALARRHGIDRVTVFAGFAAERIVAFVDRTRDGEQDVDVRVEREPLGSAGALLAALPALPEHFLVVYGDVMLSADLARMARTHLARFADVTALVHPNDHPHDSDLVETDADGWIRAVHAYPHPAGRPFNNLVNAAVYVVRRDALLPLAARFGRCDFARDVLPALVAAGGRVLGYRSTEYAKDMGTPERLARVEADWYAHRVARPDRGGYPAVLFDRDGTLNVDAGFIRSAAQIRLYPGTGAALRGLRQMGFRLAVLTNQPVIARGEASEADVAEIHRALEWQLGEEGAYVDGIYVCPHHPEGGFPGERPELKIVCDCRKPATGLFEMARRELDLDPARTWMVGDTTRDLELARRAGIRSILVRTGEAGRDGLFATEPDFIVDDVAEAARLIRTYAAADAARMVG